MIALLLTGLLALGSLQADVRPDADPVEPLRTLFELDLGAELVRAHAADVVAGGSLAQRGEAVALVARALFASGEEARARALLESFEGPDAELPHVQLARARIALDGDRLEEARRLLLDPSAPADAPRPFLPDDASACLLLGRVLQRAGAFGHSEPLLQRSLQLAPHGPEAASAWHMLGEAARRRRDVDAARTYFARATEARQWQELYRARRLQLRASPADPLPRLGLGLLWLEAGQPERAHVEFTRLVEDHPGFARGWQYRAEAARQTGALGRALADFGRALELDGSLPLARAQRGALLAEADHFEEADADFARFLLLPEARDRGYAVAHWHHARVLDRLGRPEEATAAWERYRALGGQLERAR